jgi:hypothetical protein
MAQEPRKEEQLTEEGLEAENGEELPDRETMMIVDPGPDVGIGPYPWPESETPDDRYEQ